MDPHVLPLTDGSKRVLVSQVGPIEHPTFIVNSYMLTDGCSNDYAEVLEVFALMQNYRSKEDVIWIGDLNASLHIANPSSNDRNFITFCNELQLQSLNHGDTQPTYHYFIGNIKSRIDHI